VKYKTLFRVLLRLIGVWLVANGIADAATHAGNFFGALLQSRNMGTISLSMWRYYYFSWLGPMVHVGIGCYLFFGGKWIVDKAIPGNRRYCHECGYDLTGATGNVCNECGVEFRRAEDAK
jgi:hypothetical protein